MIYIFIYSKKRSRQDTPNYTFALAGNPNVGKSSIFNSLTGLNQHTGNWTGKTVEITDGNIVENGSWIKLIDLPGSYSLKHNSPEEEITGEFISNNSYDCIIIVVDSTALERNLSFVVQILRHTNKAVLCLNMIDESRKLNISIDTDELSLRLGIPVVETCAKSRKTTKKLIESAIKVSENEVKTFTPSYIDRLAVNNEDYESSIQHISTLCENIANACIGNAGEKYTSRHRKLDYLFTSRVTGIPIMFVVFGLIFWLTAYGANYPSEMLSNLFFSIKQGLNSVFNILNINETFRSFVIDGVYTTVTWVVSVMLPPALIFFPLFALMEESGFLPRVAFNLDRLFKGCGTNGKQALTMLMGFGCNACGVMGCRIINSPRERLISIITNSFVPCNGRIPTLIAIISIYFTTYLAGFQKSLITTGILLLMLVMVFLLTLFISLILSRTALRGETSGFVLELPPFRKPKIFRVILLSLKEKVLFVLSRAIMVAIPVGAIIWLLGNIQINGCSILSYITDFAEPLGVLIGIDGVILMAFILGFPANEIVVPIILMSYLSNSSLTDYASISQLGILLSYNGWSTLTAVCTCVMCLLHFPCSTTCFAIYKETKSFKWTAFSIILPLVLGMTICLLITTISRMLI